MTRILLSLIAFYQRWLSPALHAFSITHCKFVPTCSEYAAVAIATRGPLRGGALAFWRLLRCHPFSPGGFDPVPPDRSSPACPDAAGAQQRKATPQQPLP